MTELQNFPFKGTVETLSHSNGKVDFDHGPYALTSFFRKRLNIKFHFALFIRRPSKEGLNSEKILTLRKMTRRNVDIR